MLTVEFKEIGKAEEKIELVDKKFSESLKDNDILLDVILFPINPADILLVEGKYSELPEVPSKIGAECIALVTKVGKKVKKIKEGDLVVPYTRENWVQKKILNENHVFKLRHNVNITQACMLKVNPASAYLMLNNYLKLRRNDFIMQNAANSGVGNYIIQLSKYYEINTINLVRNKKLFKHLYDMGADLVLKYDHLEEQLENLKNKNIKLFLDAVGGENVKKLASVLCDNASIINYGLLSNKDIEISSHELIFRNISIKGFWLSLWLEKMKIIEKQNLYTHLEELINNNVIYTPIQKIYDIKEINKAIIVSKKFKRSGKILVSPNYQKYKSFFSTN